jgi:hypothetical protein
MATPIIINTASIKNYSQLVPKWDILQNVKTKAEFQNYNFDFESTTLRNAIIIPLPILCIILTSPDHSPASLAMKLLHKMHYLDDLNTKTKKDIKLLNVTSTKNNNKFT